MAFFNMVHLFWGQRQASGRRHSGQVRAGRLYDFARACDTIDHKMLNTSEYKRPSRELSGRICWKTRREGHVQGYGLTIICYGTSVNIVMYERYMYYECYPTV